MADLIILCAGCRYWSDQRARMLKSGLQAKCLHQIAPTPSRWVYGHHSCAYGEPGEPIDTPPIDEALTAAGKQDRVQL
jgi:hypothetical protein